MNQSIRFSSTLKCSSQAGAERIDGTRHPSLIIGAALARRFRQHQLGERKVCLDPPGLDPHQSAFARDDQNLEVSGAHAFADLDSL